MGTGYFGTMVTPSLYAEFEILVLESAALIPLLPLPLILCVQDGAGKVETYTL